MPIYKICNVGTNKCLNINGSNILGVNLEGTSYNVNIWTSSTEPEQKWFVERINTNTSTFIRSYMNNKVGLNYVTTNGNCNIHEISGNEKDAEVVFETTAVSGRYKIRLKNYSNKYLTVVSGTNGADGSNVTWSSSSSSNYQLWTFDMQIIVDFSSTSTVYATCGIYQDSAANYMLAANESKRIENGKYIYNYFKALKFTKAAICAMLGNFQFESTINPGMWEHRISTDNYDCSKGYGIAQLTSAQDFIDWCYRINLITINTSKAIIALCNSYPQTLMNAELMYILWECEVLGGTFYPGAKGTLLNIKTFNQFKTYAASTQPTINTLSDVFCSYFERPNPPVNYADRQEYAWDWYKKL